MSATKNVALPNGIGVLSKGTKLTLGLVIVLVMAIVGITSYTVGLEGRMQVLQQTVDLHLENPSIHETKLVEIQKKIDEASADRYTRTDANNDLNTIDRRLERIEDKLDRMTELYFTNRRDLE